MQGGLHPELRSFCVDELVKRNTPGYAIGGLSGGESKDDFWRMVSLCTDKLPSFKPRYCMGVGYPVDLIVCVALGVDQFDCVYPCRTARFGTALVSNEPEGVLKLKTRGLEFNFESLDSYVDGMINQYTRSYVHHLSGKEPIGSQLITYHNIAYQMQIMHDAREAIKKQCFPQYVQKFMEQQFPDKNYPKWVVESLQSVNVFWK